MAYTKTAWVEPQGSYLNRFKKQNETATSVEMIHDPVMTNQPTPFSVENMNKMEQGIYDAHAKDQNGAAFINYGNTGLYVENFFLGESLDSGICTLPMWKIPGDNNTAVNKVGLMGRCYLSRESNIAYNINAIVDIILIRAYKTNALFRTSLGYTFSVGVIKITENNTYWLALLIPEIPATCISFTGCMFGTWNPPGFMASGYEIIAQAA
jgi:hypothetical protein